MDSLHTQVVYIIVFIKIRALNFNNRNIANNMSKILLIILGRTKTISCKSPYDIVETRTTTIISPNYPGKYENYLDCQVTIKFSEGQRVSILFETLNIEGKSGDGIYVILTGWKLETGLAHHRLH